MTATVFRLAGKTTRVDGGYRLTGGEGRFVVELSHYEAVPPQVQQQLMEQGKKRSDDD